MVINADGADKDGDYDGDNDGDDCDGGDDDDGTHSGGDDGDDDNGDPFSQWMCTPMLQSISSRPNRHSLKKSALL